ncbi:hypothetical protein MP228_001071 [Amoeboaphelidium protococcarum]|nr:hypothetical protein MP228_001071 [Amoeboaphelidium protococcarum]
MMQFLIQVVALMASVSAIPTQVNQKAESNPETSQDCLTCQYFLYRMETSSDIEVFRNICYLFNNANIYEKCLEAVDIAEVHGTMDSSFCSQFTNEESKDGTCQLVEVKHELKIAQSILSSETTESISVTDGVSVINEETVSVDDDNQITSGLNLFANLFHDADSAQQWDLLNDYDSPESKVVINGVDVSKKASVDQEFTYFQAEIEYYEFDLGSCLLVALSALILWLFVSLFVDCIWFISGWEEDSEDEEDDLQDNKELLPKYSEKDTTPSKMLQL